MSNFWGAVQTHSGGLLFLPFPSTKFSKHTTKVNDFKYVSQFIWSSISMFMVLLLISIIAYGMSLLVPRLLENIINSVVYDSTIDYRQTASQVILLTLLYFVVFQVKNLITVELQKKLNYKISLTTIKHLLHLPYAYFDDRGEGNVLFRMGLLNQIQEIISRSSIQIVVDSISVIIMLLYICYRYSYLFVILFLCLTSLGIFLIISNRYILSIRQDELSARSDISELQTEIITSIFQIKSSRLIGYFYDHYNRKLIKHNNISSKTQRKIDLFNLIVTIFTTFSPLFILLFIANSETTLIGELFFIYSVIGMLFSYTTSLFSEAASVFMIKSSLFYLNDMFDEKELLLQGEIDFDKFNRLKVFNLNFRYNDTSGDILKNINLEINNGEKVSIIGLSGSGKSTLVKILSGLYLNYKGTILINDVDLLKISNNFFLNSISIVPQSPTIFHKTVRENIRLNDESITDEEIWDALSIVNLSDTIKMLPLGLNTKLSNKGMNFSGGQAQRLSIARAIVKQPKLLILDEATSSLDSINESFIYKNLKNIGVTFLTVSHRLSTVTDSDKIYVIDNGQIIESGKHYELLRTCPLYYNLYKEQVEDN